MGAPLPPPGVSRWGTQAFGSWQDRVADGFAEETRWQHSMIAPKMKTEASNATALSSGFSQL